MISQEEAGVELEAEDEAPTEAGEVHHPEEPRGEEEEAARTAANPPGRFWNKRRASYASNST